MEEEKCEEVALEGLLDPLEEECHEISFINSFLLGKE